MLGTGTFALPTFRGLLNSEHAVVGLVTQPDREHRGRIHPHPLKEAALAAGVPVLQPARINSAESLQALRDLQADIFVVAAYGQILSARLLAIPRLGAINLHGSLLPKYRGAAPVQYAILQGERETGVTIFQIEPELDAGPVYGMVRTEIGATETSGELHDRLAELAVPLTLEVLKGLEAGTLVGAPQDSSQVTKAPKISKQSGLIEWRRTAREIDCHVRGMQPWPLAWTFFPTASGKLQRLIILSLQPVQTHGEQLNNGAPGTVLRPTPQRLLVQTLDTPVELLKVQPEGKRLMSAEEFLRGQDLPAGTVFQQG